MDHLVDEKLNPEDEKKLERLLDDVQGIRGKQCEACSELLCAHEAVIAIAMGFKIGARCSSCIAQGLERSVAEFRDHVREHISKRPCYNAAWMHAGEIEGLGRVEYPSSLWPKGQNRT